MDVRPWERLDGESDAAYAAFVQYRDTIGKRVVGTHALWANKHDWAARVTAYDRFLDRNTEDLRVENARDLQRRHASLAADMAELARVEIRKRLVNAQRSPATTLPPKELLALAEAAIRLERLVAGEAESRNEVANTWADIVMSAKEVIDVDSK
jgi:hypothetical protein